MTMIRSYAALQAGAPLQPFEYEAGELPRDHVEIDVKYCGLCHSDLSMLDNDWGLSQYPFVAGHEIIGTVAAVGAGVQTVRPGQTVGLGWYSQSCMHCDQCMSGDHNLCPTAEGTIVGRHGGFADKVRAHASWVLPLPDGLDPATSGPLFCGGITVFNPIIRNGIAATDRVGVIGIGGLGHMAVKLAHAMGAEVTVISRSNSKKDDAARLGADHYVATEEAGALRAHRNEFDLIINTVSAPLDLDTYLRLLRLDGTMVNVGAPPEPLSLRVFTLFGNRRSFAGSSIGGIRETQEMLDFCAEHGIVPDTELIDGAQVNEAWDRVLASDVRYRFVIDASTI